MNSLMNKIFKSSFFNSIFLILLGVLLIVQSEKTIISITYIIGAVIIVFGLAAIIKFIKNVNNENKNELDIVYGIVCSILGVIVIKNPNAIASIIPFIIGIVILINSATKLQYSFELKRSNNKLWKSTMIIAILTTVFGLLLIFNPFTAAEFFVQIVGGLIIAYAVLDIISTLTIKNTMNIIHNAIEETRSGIVDANVIEEEEEEQKKK